MLTGPVIGAIVSAIVGGVIAAVTIVGIVSSGVNSSSDNPGSVSASRFPTRAASVGRHASTGECLLDDVREAGPGLLPRELTTVRARTLTQPRA